jgi:predicted AlkP superfamily phosphohydrolase/phosphomutase
MKNVVIGIDGGSINHILPQVRRGKLKNFQKILNEGFASSLKVTQPPVTIPSFPCIFSGMDVQELGKCEFFNPDYGVFSSEFWRDKSIFSSNGIKSFMLNIPATYPAWEINGQMITGVLTPTINEKMVYPESLIKEIDEEWIIDGKNVAEIYQAFDIKQKFFLKKLKEDFNLYTFVIRMPDLITHYPEYTVEATHKNIQKAYYKIDKFLGQLLNHEEIDNIIILSDHGLKKFPNQFSIKKFLEDNRIMDCNKGDFVFKLLSIFFKVLSYINPKFFDIKYFHNKFKDILKSQLKFNPYENHLDSRFIQFYSNYGGIFLNDKDKKKKPFLIKILNRNNNIKRVIEFNSKNLPDLLIILNDNYLFNVRGSFFIKTQFNSYNHHDKGIFLAYGRNIINGRKKEISYLDIVPTLLKLLNLPKTRNYKGKIVEMFKLD